MSSSNKRHLDSFFLKPIRRCRYCKEEVYRTTDGYSIEPSSATIDHVFSKLDIRRHLVPNNQNIVLCCHKCNDMRNELEKIKLSTEYLNYGFINHVMTNIGFEIKPLNNWRL